MIEEVRKVMEYCNNVLCCCCVQVLRYLGEHFDQKDCHNSCVVNGMGNPWVKLPLPVPLPVKTRTHATGTGICTGQAIHTHGYTHTRTRGR